MTRIILIALLLMVAGAHAQTSTLTCPVRSDGTPIGGLCLSQPQHSLSDDPKLDRAFAICDAHRDYNVAQTIPETLGWEPGYDMCAAVNDAWQRSDAAAHQRDRQRAEEADRAFLGDYAKTLMK